ncbi:hypothetical protein INT45_004656, partial [Circinella minor]
VEVFTRRRPGFLGWNRRFDVTFGADAELGTKPASDATNLTRGGDSLVEKSVKIKEKKKCFQMSTRAEKFIHQTENTEHRHKIDYTTSLYDAWIADQSDENIMHLDENVNAAETEPVMLGSMLGPDEGDMDDFDDYDFGDQEPPVIMDLSNNQEDTTETDNNDDFMDEGTLPGPKEPSNHQMNHYMEPLVKELEKLYEGVPISNDPNSPTMRALLLSVNCDIPAARKVGAFTGIQSFCACYRCDRKFTQLPGSILRNWGGFDFAWQDRDEAKNAEGAEKWKAARTPQERERIENKYGTRCSPLCQLKYFQRSRQVLLDPFHNLYLGTCKRMMELWRRMVNPTTGKPLLTKDHFAEMQREAELIELPPGFNISKTKIGGHFAFMKGAEWRMWVLALSSILLKNHLPPQHLKIWLKFVCVNKLLAGPSITSNEIDRAHLLLKQFCIECEELYGCQEITPNMHSHVHLKSQIYDFGPIYSVWNLNFECYNGLLKSINTNHKDSFETTYMCGFLELGFADNFVTEKSRWFAGEPDFIKILTRLTPHLSPPPIDLTINAAEFDLNTFINYAKKWNGRLEVSGWEPLLPSTLPLDLKPHISISDDRYELLLQYYRHMYLYDIFKSYHIEDVDAPGEMVGYIIQKMLSVKILGQLYRSDEARSKKGINVQALFLETDNNGNPVIREGRQQL